MDKHCNVYTYWGVSFDTQNGEEFICECPFCGHNDTRSGLGHFYVNAKTAAFCCKSGSCGKEGSWRNFLHYIYTSRLKKTTDKHLERLMQLTGIPVPIFKQRKIAYDLKRKGFLYPIYNDNDEIIDLRIFRQGQKEQSTKGCNVYLTNLKEIVSATPEHTIYICEGWRDECALAWLFWRTGTEKSIVCSTPGSNTFRDYWTTHFNNKRVVVCFDNDEAGYGSYDEQTKKATGTRRIQHLLKHSVRNLKFIYWDKSLPVGYDLRQFIIDNKKDPQKALNKFNSMLVSKHPHDIKEKEDGKEPDDLFQSAKDNVKIEAIIEQAKQIYELDKHFLDAFKLSLSTIVAAKFPGDVNPWMFLVGAPSTGKTAILGLFEDAFRHVVWESSVSSKALVSGWGLGDKKKADVSVLSEVNGKCLIFKDFTEVLKKPQSERDEIFSILRGAFDGRVKKPFGTGVRQYLTDFTLLAGVTHEIRAYSNTSVGERFLQYEPKITIDQEVIQEKALNSQLLGKEKLEELKNTVTNFLDNYYDFSGGILLGRVPRWFRDRVVPLSNLVANLRTSVARFEKGLKWSHMIYDPSPEAAHRVNIQLEKLAIGLSLIEDKPQIDEEIYDVILKVALDTAYSMSAKIVLCLAGYDGSLTKQQLTERCGVRHTGKYIEDLEILSFIEKNGTHNSKPAYKATKLIKDLWKRANVS